MSLDPQSPAPLAAESDAIADVRDEALARLGRLAALTLFVVLGLEVLTLVVPALRLGEAPAALRAASIVPLTLVSTVVLLAARRGAIPAARVADLGFAYQLVSVLSAATLASPIVLGEPTRPPFSPVSSIVLLSPIFVIAGPGRTALAGLASLLIEIAALTATASLDMPALLGPLARRVMPTLVAVPIAVFIAHVVRGMREKLSAERRAGSYRLIERIGQGGMGEVWRATHRLLARPAAVKLIRPDRLEDAERARSARARFEREASVIAGLRSPHTVQLYDYGVTSDGALFYVMELLEGVDLDRLVATEGAQPAPRVVPILRQICRSLQEAHTAGLVHRDLKPANVVVGPYGGETDHVKVLDFGLVASLHAAPEQTEITRERAIVGTPGYVAPEVALGEPFDARADLYALGCIAFFLLTGRPVFEGSSLLELAVRHATATPPRVSDLAPGPVPPELELIVARLLAKDPASRFASARDVDRALASVHSGPRNDASALAFWNARTLADLGS